MSELMIQADLDGIRADVAEFFEDQCTIVRPDPNDPPVLNKATAELEGGTNIPIYTGVCFVKPIISRRDRFDEVGQGLVFTRQYRVGLPWTVTTVQIRDLLTVTASDDPQLIGRPMLIRDVLVGTNIGYRRLTAQDTRE